MVITKSLQLDSDHFNFDLTPGFEMAVEKEWNVLDFADLNQSLTMYDSSHHSYVPNRYGVRIFYKAVVPMCYVDGETYETNPLVRTAHRGGSSPDIIDLVNGTAIGSPVLKMTQGVANQSFEYGYHGLLIADDVPSEKAAYALPSDSDLNDTTITKSDFASGSSISKLKDDSYYLPLDTGSHYSDLVQNGEYILLGPGGQNSGGVASFIVNNGALAYSIDTSSNAFNLPSDIDHESGHKYLLPMLFKPFGVAFKDVLDQNDNTAGWFYCVLGVKDFGDPSYDIDPAIERFAYGEYYIDPDEGWYSYDLADVVDHPMYTLEDLEITVYDNVEILSISINDTPIQVPVPVNNKYTIPSSDLSTPGEYLIDILTEDTGGNQLEYSLVYVYTTSVPEFDYIYMSADDVETVAGEYANYTYYGELPNNSDPTTQSYKLGFKKMNGSDVIDIVNTTPQCTLESTTGSGDVNYEIPISVNELIAQDGFTVTFKVNDGYNITVYFSMQS